jgi:hypothetical protein
MCPFPLWRGTLPTHSPPRFRTRVRFPAPPSCLQGWATRRQQGPARAAPSGSLSSSCAPHMPRVCCSHDDDDDPVGWRRVAGDRARRDARRRRDLLSPREHDPRGCAAERIAPRADCRLDPGGGAGVNRRDCRTCKHVGEVVPDQRVVCTRDRETIPWWVATDESPCGWFEPAGRGVTPMALCGAVCRGLVCTRKRGHGGVFHVARGLGSRVVLKWRIQGSGLHHSPGTKEPRR